MNEYTGLTEEVLAVIIGAVRFSAGVFPPDFLSRVLKKIARG